MPVPGANNEITMGKIYQEVDGSGYVAHDGSEEVSLQDLSTGSAPDTLNTNSSSRPDGSPPHAMSEFHGYNHSATPPFSWNSINSIPQQWGDVTNNVTSFGSASTIINLGFVFQPANNRVRLRHANATQSTGTTYSFINNTYSGNLDNGTMKAKITWSGAFTGSTGSGTDKSQPSDGTSGGNSFTWTSGTFHTINKDSTSSSSADTTSGLYSDAIWKASVSNPNQSITYDAGTFSGTAMTFQFQAVHADGSTTDSGSSTGNSMRFTASKQGQGGGGGGGFVCIHEDHLVHTDQGLMHIDDIVKHDPKVYGYNTETGQIELAELIKICIVKHDNLYIINDTKVTEDHILYTEGYKPVSVNPTKAKENYGKDSQEIKVGDKLMKYDGTLEEVNSIEVLEGEHRTYTLKTELDNFYANDILVDSEI